MVVEWLSAERWLMGSASVDSLISKHINTLCDTIGVRWGGSANERRAAEYIRGQFDEFGLEAAVIEDFDVDTWESTASSITIQGEEDRGIDVRPSLFCPPVDVTAPLIDVGFGMPHELEPLLSNLKGAVVLITGAFEPFSPPETLTFRLEHLATLGVVAAITPYASGGHRTAHAHLGDWRDDDPHKIAMPIVHTSREDGALLGRRAANTATVTVRVESARFPKPSTNVVGEIRGDVWPDEWIILSSHHDTTVDSPGANDNASGTTVVMETARLLARLKEEHGISPGRSIRFVTFGSEEQALQGSMRFVERHYGEDPLPRLVINLDELAKGSMKGVALQFPELRPLIQRELDAMGEGLKCHVMADLDSSGDMYPFALRGIPSGMLWRWRFVGGHPDAAFGHSANDTVDKVRIRELKEYSGFLSRILLRTSHVVPEDWPENKLDVAEIKARTVKERGSVVRTM